MKHIHCVLPFSFIFAFFLTAAPAGAQANDWRSKVAPELLAALDRGETVDLLAAFRDRADLGGARALRTKSEKAHYVYGRLRAVAAASQASAIELLRRRQAFANSLFLVNAIAVEKADAALVRELAALPEVSRLLSDPWVYFPGPVETLAAPAQRDAVEWGVERIKAPAVWSLGYTGQGVTIGGADTGYDFLHPALAPHYRGTISLDVLPGLFEHAYHWHDAIHTPTPLLFDTINPCGFDAPAPCDDGSHGTHTMGTMTGDDLQGNQIGVAPGAKWIGCRNMDRGWGRPSSYLECFQWFLAPTDLNDENPDPDRAPHVINNSWYCSFEEGCTSLAVDSMLMQGVTNLKASGVVVVVSAGNNGPGCSTVGNPPAYFEQSFSVGSTRIDDTVSAFSSRGPVLVDGSFRAKPNVAAPGSNIRSSTPNGGYANFSGTSMAGPHVAGLVALMLSARPDLAGQVELIESIVEQTAVPKTDTSHCGGIPGSQRPNYAYGYGRVDALSAVEEILTATPDFTPGQTIAVHVFPNPLQDRVFFDVNHPGGGMMLEIFSADGRRVYERAWQSGGRETIDVRLTNQPPGVYFWQMRGESGQAQGKLMVE